MSVLIQNQGNHVEYVNVVSGAGDKDVVTVQPGSRVDLPEGYRVAPATVATPHIKVTGNDKPVSSLTTVKE